MFEHPKRYRPLFRVRTLLTRDIHCEHRALLGSALECDTTRAVDAIGTHVQRTTDAVVAALADAGRVRGGPAGSGKHFPALRSGSDGKARASCIAHCAPPLRGRIPALGRTAGTRTPVSVRLCSRRQPPTSSCSPSAP